MGEESEATRFLSAPCIMRISTVTRITFDRGYRYGQRLHTRTSYMLSGILEVPSTASTLGDMSTFFSFLFLRVLDDGQNVGAAARSTPKWPRSN